jgi:muramoyltetrapeptide carboxypeptidase
LADVLRPPALKRGDTVGIYTPSVPLPSLRPRRFTRGIAELERLGFCVRLAKHARGAQGHRSGTIAERVADLHELFADPEVRCVMSAIGGFNSNSLLEELDYDLIGANPKVFVGYSDVTALHAAIWSRTGLAVVLGPAVMVQFGEFDGVDPYTWSMFERTVTRAEPAGVLEPSSEWTDELLEWDERDDRRRARRPNQGPRVVREGLAEGPIVAGNCTTLLGLAGTSFWPDLDGAILCIEDDAEETPARVDRMLTQLRLLGVYERIAGLALGRFQPGSGFGADAPLDPIVLEATRGHEFPVVADLDFGHTDPMLSLPWGVNALLDATEEPRFELREAAVVPG